MRISDWYGELPSAPLPSLARAREMCQQIADDTDIRESHVLGPWIARYALRLIQASCEVSYASLGEYYVRYAWSIAHEIIAHKKE